jgi:uncharacterized repeat protein (TIGR04076 family)
MMKIDENAWKMFQQHLGYTDEEMAKFRADPRNAEVLLKAPELMNKTIVAEVVESHGCNSQHKVGDKFYIDGAGNLISKLCPNRMCLYAVSALKPAVFALNELFYAGVDPNEMRFNRTGCSDVGVECGGWGRIVMAIRAEDRKK